MVEVHALHKCFFLNAPLEYMQLRNIVYIRNGCDTQKMEIALSFRSSVNVYQTAWHHPRRQ
jgi:hypothetical protein